MKKIGIILNYTKRDIIDMAKEILQGLQSKAEVIAYGQDAEKIGLNPLPLDEFCKKADLVIVIGGDGTLLRAARLTYGYDLPILGINRGYLGFLSELEVDDLATYFDILINGDYKIEKRMMLEAFAYHNDVCVAHHVALNDMVITKGALARIISIKIKSNNAMVDEFLGDGLIVATATGSTGYSLSAGGPILYPSLNTMILTPICPHSLTSRPVVLPSEVDLEITIGTDVDDCMLTVDGQQGVDLKNKDKVVIKRAQHATSLVRLKDTDFFEVLHTKFKLKGADKFI